MDPDSVKYLSDVIKSIELIEQYLEGVADIEAYENDLLLIDGVERRIGIIGEAIWQVSKLNPDMDVTDLRKIISLRHIVVHAYNNVLDETIWRICKQNLPLLKGEVQKILHSN